ncbi:MAG: EAL domain-containing protein [Sphingopyxis sp.]
MSAPQSHLSETLPIPLLTVVCGGNLPGTDLTQLRADQCEHTRKSTFVQLAAILIGALGIIVGNLATQPLWLLGAYGGAVCAILAIRTMMAETRQMGWIHATSGFALREMLLGIVTGVILAAPMLWFAWTGDAQAATNAWLITVTMIALYGYSSASIPIMFCATMPLVGVISAAAMGATGNWLAATSALLFTVVTTVTILTAGRDFIRSAILGRKADERGETVSLLLREFEDTSADWLWQLDSNRRVSRPSPRFAHAVGQEPEAIEGEGFLQLLAGEHWDKGNLDPGLHELANRLNRRESFSNLHVPINHHSGQRWWEISASPNFDSSGNFSGFRGVGSDITEQRTSAERIAHLARFDALTGLPNRLFLNETLAGALEQAATWRRRCAFLMIDLDRFKAVNDTLGHPIGDRLLAQVAARLSQLCGDNVIGGRLGGDEFGVVMREVDSIETIERLGHRIVEVISRPYEIDHHTLYVGASLGYAIGPRDGASVEALTRNADLALYRSKDKGGGVINSYEPSLHDQARQRREIEIELRSALTKNEFSINFQPVVSAEGHVDGFEALLRWTNKKLGNVSPAQFIPVAEDSRLIGPIGEWVLQGACREAINWPETTKVAVNVSAEQLSSPGFVGSVVKALSHSGLNPSRLEIEVTESVFLREVSGAMATLDQIRALGVKLVLDDFGTGYSSLGYLRMGQFSTIKVDRSFVQGALKGNRESIAIIRAVVALADSLEMSTTAEGVESQAEADAIIALGCKKLQGYHFGRPMPAEDARAIFAKTFDLRTPKVA